MELKYYVAPLEGITNYIFRNTLYKHFPRGIDGFCSPFIVPKLKRAMTVREFKDVLKENNKVNALVPQVLTRSPEGFLFLADKLRNMGYEEINLNLGCPSGTVTASGKGAAFLKDPIELENFFKEIYSSMPDLTLSVKTRIGYEKLEELEDLIEVYNLFPFKNITIHPRLGKEMYRGNVHMDEFLYSLQKLNADIIYNGDIKNSENRDKVLSAVKEAGLENKLTGIMVGRGLVSDPLLLERLNAKSKEGRNGENGEIVKYSEDKRVYNFLTEYTELTHEEMGEGPALQKLKEIWGHMSLRYTSFEREGKKILKSKTVSEAFEYLAQILNHD
ncbi:MAG: tRNA-dihydrouridine synthase family protein [Lachnospiraceae bacterium]|nr:tRNA-dihydrouridine synthase family protein [Lachnospiraceae bacterium]